MAKRTETVAIKPANFGYITIQVTGTAPLCILRFGSKAAQKMKADQEAGSTKKKNKAKEAKDFDALYRDALYVSEDGWYGLHAGGLRNAAISACRTVGFAMTLAKLSLFVEADGFDREDGTPLIRIHGEPTPWTTHVRNATGVVDLRIRPVWKPGWKANLRLRYDADQFTASDVVNLISRVGMQVGLGEGRPDSKKSAGLGYGLFTIDTEQAHDD